MSNFVLEEYLQITERLKILHWVTTWPNRVGVIAGCAHLINTSDKLINQLVTTYALIFDFKITTDSQL